MKNAIEFLWRGAVGGAAGCLIALVCAPDRVPVGFYLLIGAIFLMLAGGVFGAVVGFLVWFLSLKSKKVLAPPVRACIGVGASLLLMAGVGVTSEGKPNMAVPTWGSTIQWAAVYAGVGLLTGLMAYSKRAKE